MQIALASVFTFFVFGQDLMAQCNSSKTSQKSHQSQQRVHRTSYSSTKSYRSTSTQHKRDLVQLAANERQLSTLVAAVKAAGLVETLQGKGPFTIFAPTNTAFAALPEGTVETLLKPENKDQLIKILTYHVVPGRVEANDLSNGKITSVQGSKINVDLSSGAVKINDALVTDANNRAINGVVHIIDRVILPPGM